MFDLRPVDSRWVFPDLRQVHRRGPMTAIHEVKTTAQVVCAVWLIGTVTTARALYVGFKHVTTTRGNQQ